MWEKHKDKIFIMFLTSILTSGTIMGINIKDWFKPQFSDGEKVLIINTMSKVDKISDDLTVLLEDYKKSGMTLQEIAKHVNDEDTHMSFKSKMETFVLLSQYKSDTKRLTDDIQSIKTKLELLLAHNNREVTPVTPN